MMEPPRAKENSGDKETGRLESFSDGVFSIAMTLLVLELSVPKLNGAVKPRALLWALMVQWPSYLAFVTSFFTVLIMWVNHHGIFRLVRRTDSTLLFANGFLLLLVTVVPFPTALVATYLRTPAAGVVCAVYSGTFVLISISYSLLLSAARRGGGHLTVANAGPEISRRLRDSWLIGTPLYLIGAVVAPIAPSVTLCICTGLWVFWSVGRGGTGAGFAR